MRENRRAYIEYLSKSRIRITTPYRQQEFTVSNNCAIDLISLKKLKPNHKSRLYVIFSYDEEEDSYLGIVHTFVDKLKKDVAKQFDFTERNVDIRTSTWADD